MDTDGKQSEPDSKQVNTIYRSPLNDMNTDRFDQQDKSQKSPSESMTHAVGVEKRQGMNRLQIGIVTAVVIIAVITNPSQELHLAEVAKIAAYRDPSKSTSQYEILTRYSVYNDYFLFSTMSCGGHKYIPSEYTLTYGFLGFIKTTSGVGYAMTDAAIAVTKEAEKPK